MITQETRNAVADYLQSTDDDGHTYDAFRRGQCDNHPLMLAFESHGIAAEQAVLDRLRNLPDDVALKVYQAAGDIGVDLAPSMARLIITAAVDALESDILEQQP